MTTAFITCVETINVNEPTAAPELVELAECQLAVVGGGIGETAI